MLNLYIDPSITCMGLALFKDGELDAAYTITTSPKSKNRLWDIATDIEMLVPIDCVNIYYEAPVLRARGVGAKPEDLFKLSQALGAAVGGIAAHLKGPLTPLHAVDIAGPKGWKGQLPKEVTHAHMERVLSEEEKKRMAVSLEETSTKESLRHNAYDAVCMGLYIEGRAPWKKRPASMAPVNIF